MNGWSDCEMIRFNSQAIRTDQINPLSAQKLGKQTQQPHPLTEALIVVCHAQVPVCVNTRTLHDAALMEHDQKLGAELLERT